MSMTRIRFLQRGLPREGERVNVNNVKGKIISVNVFKRTVIVEREDGTQSEVQYK